MRDKIEKLISFCFGLGQGGWNEAEDESEYTKRAISEAKRIGLLDDIDEKNLV